MADALCQCGHSRDQHAGGLADCWDSPASGPTCRCESFRPAVARPDQGDGDGERRWTAQCGCIFDRLSIRSLCDDHLALIKDPRPAPAVDPAHGAVRCASHAPSSDLGYARCDLDAGHGGPHSALGETWPATPEAVLTDLREHVVDGVERAARMCECPDRNPDCEHPTCPRYPQPGHLAAERRPQEQAPRLAGLRAADRIVNLWRDGLSYHVADADLARLRAVAASVVAELLQERDPATALADAGLRSCCGQPSDRHCR